MPEIVECVINISEGRDAEKIERITAGLSPLAGVRLLGVHSDPDHHRSVLTLAGTPPGVLEGAKVIFSAALNEIDLSSHTGLHPRIGAVDVVPFAPVRSSLARCVRLARDFGKWAGGEYSVPVFFYEAAAVVEDRKTLAEIRRGGLAGLRARMERFAEWKPDHGPDHLHPTAGAVVVGARPFLIAFNVLLESRDLALAQKIARAIRESSGGMAHVRALGLYLEHRGRVQVSMNLTDFRRTSLFEVFERIEQEAAREGVAVLESEVVGFLPRGALKGGEIGSLAIRGFSPDMILENRIRELAGWKV